MCRSAVQYSTVKKLSSARFRFSSVLALAQFRPLQTNNTPTQPSPAQPRHGGEDGKVGDGNEGGGTSWSVVV